MSTSNTRSYVYGVIAQGFDGVVLGSLEAYRIFEDGVQDGPEDANEAAQGPPASPNRFSLVERRVMSGLPDAKTMPVQPSPKSVPATARSP